MTRPKPKATAKTRRTRTPKKASRAASPPRAKKRTTTAAPSRKAGRSSRAASTAASTPDWRLDLLDRVRRLIQRADPLIVEEVKWRKPSNGMRGVPVWSRGGIICTGETYTKVVKLTFAKGASLEDPHAVFNASLDGRTRRAIDLHEGDDIDVQAFTQLVRGAVALNLSKGGSNGQ